MTILIPAYQPDGNMIDLIKELKNACDYSIVVVDDGSDPACDPVFTEAEALGCVLLRHESNRGKGAALKTGIAYLLDGREMEGAVTADCDGQHSVTDIWSIEPPILDYPDKIILGIREFAGKMPLRSLMGNTLTRAAYRIASGQNIRDTQTGLRGMSATMFQWLVDLKGDRYDYEMNMLLEANQAGYSFYQLPIDTIYINRNAGSHFQTFRDSVKVYKPILTYCFSGIASGVIDFIMLMVIHQVIEWVYPAWSGHQLQMLISVVGARIVSSLCNFLINRSIVFGGNKRKRKTSHEVARYYTLVAGMIVVNYFLMELLTNMIGIPLAVSKILTEALLVFISFYIQKHWVFKRKA